MAASSENKTQPNSGDVGTFIAAIANEKKRADALMLVEMMTRLSGHPARMWGSAIVGFGQHHYKYASGREGDSLEVGFSPRKANLTLYIAPGFAQYEALLARLGKHCLGKSCLYIKRLSDIDLGVLETLIEQSIQQMRRRYP
jgi:hypothetical protein